MSNEYCPEREQLKNELAETLAYSSLDEIRTWLCLLQSAKQHLQNNKITEQT